MRLVLLLFVILMTIGCQEKNIQFTTLSELIKLTKKLWQTLRFPNMLQQLQLFLLMKLRRLNSNVVIFPNAINPNEPQFKEPTP
jgi:hypothetical protein